MVNVHKCTSYKQSSLGSSVSFRVQTRSLKIAALSPWPFALLVAAVWSIRNLFQTYQLVRESKWQKARFQIYFSLSLPWGKKHAMSVITAHLMWRCWQHFISPPRLFCFHPTENSFEPWRGAHGYTLPIFNPCPRRLISCWGSGWLGTLVAILFVRTILRVTNIFN